jgi:hypothetical protein
MQIITLCIKEKNYKGNPTITIRNNGVPSLTHGSETWIIAEKVKGKIQFAEMIFIS